MHEGGIQDGAHSSSVPIVRAVPGRAMKVVTPALITKGVERIGEGMMEIKRSDMAKDFEVCHAEMDRRTYFRMTRSLSLLCR